MGSNDDNERRSLADVPFDEAEKRALADLASAIYQTCRKWSSRGGCPESYLYSAIYAHHGGKLEMRNIDQFVRQMVEAGLLVKRGECYFAPEKKEAH